MMMKKLKLMMAASAVLVASVAGVAAAQGGRGADGDRPDRAEMKQKWQDKKQAMLLRYDFNKNGALDDTEKDAMHAERSAKRFERLDANGDGVLSQAEFSAGKQGRRGHRGHRRGQMGKGRF